MNLIFAIPENSQIEAKAAYLQLVAHIEGSSHGTLSSDCSNIVNITKDNYQVITGRAIALLHCANGDMLTVNGTQRILTLYRIETLKPIVKT